MGLQFLCHAISSSDLSDALNRLDAAAKCTTKDAAALIKSVFLPEMNDCAIEVTAAAAASASTPEHATAPATTAVPSSAATSTGPATLCALAELKQWVLTEVAQNREVISSTEKLPGSKEKKEVLAGRTSRL